MTKDNHLLGTFELGGIPPGPRGQPQIEVTFDIDVNGILTVSAEEKSTNKVETVTITSDKGRLSQEEIDRMVQEAEEMAEQDKEARERVTARNTLEGLVYSVKSQLSDEKLKLAEKLDEEDITTLKDAVKEAQEWLDEHISSDKDEYDTKKTEFEGVVHPIFAKIQPKGGAPGGEEGADEEMPDHDDL
jgi:heat shock protein 5